MAKKKKASAPPKKATAKNTTTPPVTITTALQTPPAPPPQLHIGQCIWQLIKAQGHSAKSFAGLFDQHRNWTYRVCALAIPTIENLLLLSKHFGENLLLKIVVDVPALPSAAEVENGQMKLRITELEQQAARVAQLEQENLLLQARLDELHLVMRKN